MAGGLGNKVVEVSLLRCQGETFFSGFWVGLEANTPEREAEAACHRHPGHKAYTVFLKSQYRSLTIKGHSLWARGWVEWGRPGRPRTDSAASFLFPPSLELSWCQDSSKLAETPGDTDSEPPAAPSPLSFPWKAAAATRGVITEH